MVGLGKGDAMKKGTAKQAILLIVCVASTAGIAFVIGWRGGRQSFKVGRAEFDACAHLNSLYSLRQGREQDAMRQIERLLGRDIYELACSALPGEGGVRERTLRKFREYVAENPDAAVEWPYAVIPEGASANDRRQIEEQNEARRELNRVIMRIKRGEEGDRHQRSADRADAE